MPSPVAVLSAAHTGCLPLRSSGGSEGNKAGSKAGGTRCFVLQKSPLRAVFSAGTQAANKARVVLWRWLGEPWLRREVGPSNGPNPGSREICTLPTPPSPEGLQGEALLGAVVRQQWSQEFTGSPQHCCHIPGGFAGFGCTVFTALVCPLLFGERQHVSKNKFTVALFDPLSFNLLDRDCPSWGRKYPLPALLWGLISPLLKPFHQLLGRSFHFWYTPCFGLGPCFGLRAQLTPKCSPEKAGTQCVPPVPPPQPAPDPSKLFSCNVQPFSCSSTCKDPCNPQPAASSAGLMLEQGVPQELVTTGTSVKCFISCPFPKMFVLEKMKNYKLSASKCDSEELWAHTI